MRLSSFLLMQLLKNITIFPFLILVLLNGVCTSLVHSAPLSLGELEMRLQVYQSKIQQQAKNIADMKAELQQAAQQKRMPNVGRLHPYATATGQRTQAYYNEPVYIRKLIEEIENNHALSAAHTAILVTGAATGQYGISRAHYIVEIARSNELIKLLKREEKAVVAQLRSLGAAVSAPGYGPSAASTGPMSKTLVDVMIEPTWPLPTPIYPATGPAVVLEYGEATNLKAWALFSDGSRKEVTAIPQRQTERIEWSPAKYVHNGAFVGSEIGVHIVKATYVSGYGQASDEIEVAVIRRPSLKVTKRGSPPGIIAGKDTRVRYTIEVEFTAYPDPQEPIGPVFNNLLENVTVTDSQCSNLTAPTLSIMYSTDLQVVTCEQTLNRATVNTVNVEGSWGPYKRTVRASDTFAVTERSPTSDKKPPELRILSHSDGDTVDQANIRFQGVASDKGRGDNGIWMVFLNDRWISLKDPLKRTGGGAVMWDEGLTLKPGANRITVNARDNSHNYNETVKTITIYYEPPPSAEDSENSEPETKSLVIIPRVKTVGIGETLTFRALVVGEDGLATDVTDSPQTKWLPDKVVTAETPGTITVKVIHKSMMVTAVITVGEPAPADLTRPRGGPPGGRWNILFKPDGTDRPNCYKFMVAEVGGDRLAEPGVLTPKATREGWSIDSAGGAGPYEGWSWADWKQVNARMTELSVYGDDWYGCRKPPKARAPRVGVGWVSPLPPGVVPYGIWRKHHHVDPPNCYEFHAAPLAKAEEIDSRAGWEREPNFFGPYAKNEVNAIVSNLSRYGGDYYGCLTEAADSVEGESSLPDHAIFIISVEGKGFSPHWAGASYIQSGFHEEVLWLKRGEELKAKLQAYHDHLVGNICEIITPPGTISKDTLPQIWDSGPKITVVAGPFTEGKQLEGRELKDSWKTVRENGPSLGKLREDAGCE